MMVRLICALALLPWLSNPGFCQPHSAGERPAPQAVLEAWRDAQESAARAAGRIAFEERLDRVIDSPRGRMRLRVVSHVEGDPARRNWDREIIEATRNGRRIPRDELRHFDRPGPGPRPGRGLVLGDPGNRVLYPPAFDDEVFRRLAPVADPKAEMLDGRPAWQIELAPARLDEPARRGGGPPRIEGLTLWLSDGNPPRLLRAVIRGTHPRTNTPSDRETTFGPFGPLDVPLQSRFEIQVEQHRRIRTYTLMSQVDVHFSNYRRITDP